MSDGFVEFEIRADNSDVGKKIQDTTSKLKSAAGQWESSTTGAANSSSMFSSVLQGVGMNLGNMITNAARAAGKAVVEFGKECITAASDLAEVQNVVDTVFGDSAGEIYSWAQSAQSSFGLAQTQALKYASTLGAMMKSSGLGIDEVKEMSTTLSGLAADMASFYNMDFDTAFEKLRSGISGETEPLKQLGINLSVANLEAYALSQGIEKAYSEMSQAEQVALRYNYIMSATADAQGDFSRTSDGYANSLRRIETAWDTIKTSVGQILLPVVGKATDAVADFLEVLTTPPNQTIFERFDQIEIDFEAEMTEITKTHEVARALIDTLEELHASTAVPEASEGLQELIGSLASDIPGLYDKIAEKNPTDQISALAAALSNGSGVSLEAWTTALTTYDEFSGKLSAAMESDNPTEAIKELAAELSAGSDISVEGWTEILSTFADSIGSENIKGSTEDVIDEIGKLSSALEAKTGVDSSAWEKAFQTFDGYKKEFFSALDSDDPGEKLDKLAKKLSAKDKDITVEEWQIIFTTLQGYLSDADSNLSVDGIISKLTGLTAAVDDEVKKLSTALEGKTGVDVSAWQKAFDTFEGYRNDFFSALGSNDPGAKLDELAKKLSAQDKSITVEEWQKIFTTLKEYITTADSELSVDGIVSKLSKLTGAVSEASEMKLSDVLGQIETDAGSQNTNIDAWSLVLDTFSQKIGGFKQALNDYPGGATEKVKNLATALSGLDGDEAKVGAWKELIGLLAENASGISQAMGWSESETGNWLQALTTNINSLDLTKTESFEKLFSLLTGGETLGQIDVPDDLAKSFTEAAEAIDETYYASEGELAILRELVKMFPQLSAVVNTQTGAVRGGIEALNEYVDASEAAAIKLAWQKRQSAKWDAIAAEEAEYYEILAQKTINDALLNATDKSLADIRSQMEAQGVEFNYDYDLGTYVPHQGTVSNDELVELNKEYYRLLNERAEYTPKADKLADSAQKQKDALDEARAALEAEDEALGINGKAKEDNAEATEASAQAEEDLTKKVSNLKTQLQDIVNYQENARRSVLSTLSQVVNGFQELDRTTEEYRKSFTTSQMHKNLEDQLAFMTEYSRLLDQAREKGFSDDVLAAIADGSVESMQYLRGMAKATEDDVDTLNKKYAEVTAKKNDLAAKVAEQRLRVDTEYQAMIKAAEEAAAKIDQSAAAGAGAAATMSAIVTAIQTGNSELSAAISETLALIAQLGNIGGYTVGGASGGIIGTVGNGGGGKVGHAGGGFNYVNGAYAMGLDSVPFDGFIAELHHGEAILTADEAAIWRNFTGADSAMDQQAFDYDMLTASITSGMPQGGGNVYLDGRTVGRVISQGQGDSYRRLQRSGWRG